MKEKLHVFCCSRFSQIKKPYHCIGKVSKKRKKSTAVLHSYKFNELPSPPLLAPYIRHLRYVQPPSRFESFIRTNALFAWLEFFTPLSLSLSSQHFHFPEIFRIVLYNTSYTISEAICKRFVQQEGSRRVVRHYRTAWRYQAVINLTLDDETISSATTQIPTAPALHKVIIFFPYFGLPPALLCRTTCAIHPFGNPMWQIRVRQVASALYRVPIEPSSRWNKFSKIEFQLLLNFFHPCANF